MTEAKSLTPMLTRAPKLIRDIPDFPSPGILFRDITPLLADPSGFHEVIDALVQLHIRDKVDAIVGIESRGFIFGAALAARLNASFIPVRKPGKLPGPVDEVSYKLEYGEGSLQMHQDALPKGARVVLIDDLLATGGTAAAAKELVEGQGALCLGASFVIELEALGGRSKLGGLPVNALIRYS